MEKMNSTKILKNGLKFLLVGVGGQGTILASNILAEMGLKLGFDVKKAEVHGLSQRGGSVVSHMAWGEKVFSPVIAAGEADILVAFEKLEAARSIDYLKAGGMAVVNDQQIVPLSVSSGKANYIEDDEIRTALGKAAKEIVWVNTGEIVEELGNPKVANVALLGALSGLFDFPEDVWIEVIEQRVPKKYLDLNLKAFRKGRGKA